MGIQLYENKKTAKGRVDPVDPVDPVDRRSRVSSGKTRGKRPVIDVKRSTRMRRRVVHFNHHVVLFRHTAWISSGWRPRPFRRDRRGWCAGTWGNNHRTRRATPPTTPTTERDVLSASSNHVSIRVRSHELLLLGYRGVSMQASREVRALFGGMTWTFRVDARDLLGGCWRRRRMTMDGRWMDDGWTMDGD